MCARRRGVASRAWDRSRLSRRLISPALVLRMRLRGVREKRSSLRLLCFVCRGVRGGVTYLLSTAGLGRRVCCLLCSTGLRVCCSKPFARRSRIVANSNPRMQREYCTRMRRGRAQLALSWRDCSAFASCAASSALWSRSPDASQQRATHQRIVQDTYRRRTEKRARPRFESGLAQADGDAAIDE